MADPAGNFIRLTREQVPAAAAMLTRAFSSDPKLLHLMPNPSEQASGARYLFEFELRYGMLYGDVFATSPSMEGVAVWLPSDKSEITFWRAFRSGGFMLQGQLGKVVMDRLMAFSAFVDAAHAAHAPFPHYYLFFIGVDPAFQGKGLAGHLIRPMLAWLDDRKLPCYLNTQNEQNIRLYEHFGFRVTGREAVPGSSVLHTGMLRDPA